VERRRSPTTICILLGLFVGVVSVTHSDPMLNFIQFGLCNVSGLVNDF